MDKKTTVKTKAADRLTEWREAHNTLAVAMARYARSQSVADRKAMADARKEVERLEKIYREARDLQLESVCAKQPGFKERRTLWNLLSGNP